jgi:hypothetical protein
MIGSDEAMYLRILFGFKTCLTTWPPCFMRHFLQTRTKSSWTLSRISKGEVFSFFHLCSNLCTSCKANVIKGRLLLGFDNAFTFVLYLKMFQPFVVFLNGGYNFNLRGIPLESTTFHTPSFDAHWSAFLSSFYIDNKHKKTPSCPFNNDYGIPIVITPCECRFPWKLFCLFSHFLLSCPFLHFPCFLSSITTNLASVLKKLEDLDRLMLELEEETKFIVVRILQWN